jgi:hypothetical protein
MNKQSTELLAVIDKYVHILNNISEVEASLKPAPEKWSKKEIIGHLLDSAVINHARIIRMQETNGLPLNSYAQDFWVSAQKYNERSWHELVNTWSVMNRHLANAVKNVDPDTLQNSAIKEGSQPLTLEFIISDYITHHLHHLKQVAPV